jgi:glycosyltransferase involved in cell wall biosynthesis
VHIHYGTQSILGPLSGRPFVVHCHGTDIRGVGPHTLRGRLLAPFLAEASLVLYSTPDIGADARALRSDAIFLPNPIDVDRFTPGGIRDRDLLVALRLDPVKGAETVLIGVERLLRARPSTTVTVVANGPLTPQAREFLGDRAVFVAPVPHEQMPQALGRHRVAVGQVRGGALGQLELEAMASGTPVVAGFRFPDAYDVMPPIEQARTADDVATAIQGLLDDPERRARLARDGRTWVVAHHAAAIIAARLDALYRGVLDP